MKTLVIPDIHNRVGWIERLIAKVRPDLTIFLGDYFDNFNDVPADASATACWLKYSLDQPNRVHLFGNHCLPYAFPWNKAVGCPGWTKEKSQAVNKRMCVEDWDKLKFAHYDQGWLFSHAGFHPSLFTHPMHGITVDHLLDCANVVALSYVKGNSSCRYLRGGSSMGEAGVGGLTWLRWYEFQPIEGIRQVVGHTSYPIVQSIRSPAAVEGQWSSENYNLDTFGRYYGIVNNGKFSYRRNDLL